MLTAYLAQRPKALLVPIGSPRTQTLFLSATAAASGLAVLSSGTHVVVAAGLTAIGGVLAYVGLHTKTPPPPTPEQELAAKADAVLKGIHPQIEWGRLHRAFHPAVATTLEECAGYHARIVLALERWDASELRENARLAADVAMDEAIVHAGSTLPYVAPPRPLEQLSDTLEDIGFGPLTRDGRAHEPMPPGFRPIREIAERLRELAVRCEAASTERRAEEPVSAAFRHLDATLGEMRSREEAESELRQGA